MKNIRNILSKGVLMLLASLFVMSCTEKSDWGIDSSYSRPFGTNEDGISVTKDEKVARATVIWDAMPGVEYYILEISKNELTDEIPMGSEENGNLVYGNTTDSRILKAPYLMDNLEAGASYYLRIKSVASGKESHWVYLDEPFKTVTKEAVLNVPDDEDLPVAAGKVRMSWEAGLAVTHFEIVGGATPIERTITAEEAAAGEAWIEGLKTFTAYTISIYNNETLRGSQEVVIPGLEIESTVDEITANTAKFSWETTVDVDQYICQLSSMPTPDDATGATSLNASEISAHAVTVQGLEPSTEYTVYAFYNGAICARTTFTTKKGKPAGYTEYSSDDLISNWESLSGDILVTITSDADITTKDKLPAAVTNIVFWGEGATQPKLTIKGMSAEGSLTKLEFYNLNITAGSGYIVNQNNAAGALANVVISSCTMKTLRGVVRYQAAANDKSLHLEIDDCIIDDLTGNSHYGILQTEKVEMPSIALEITNTTIANTTGTKAATILRTKNTQKNANLVVRNCTFYNLFTGEVLVRDIFGNTNSFTVENVLFAGSGSVKIFNKASEVPSTINWSNVYHSSDLTIANAGSTSTTALTYSSSQLFPNVSPDVLDLTFGSDIPNDIKAIGDPRWNK